MALNSLRYYRKTFKTKYGELVLCVDNKHYWRKDFFPNYKIRRSKTRKESKLDWNMVFDSMKIIRNELEESFPYKLINVDGAEADDVIGVLAKQTDENTVIVSKDADFIQLQTNKLINQYSATKRVFLKEPKPLEFLREKIIIGDSGDDIPNIKSADDVFATGKRQSSLKTADIERWKKIENPENFCDSSMLKNYRRNQKLIDFNFIPEDIQTNILTEYDKNIDTRERRRSMVEYFTKHRLSTLFDEIGEF